MHHCIIVLHSPIDRRVPLVLNGKRSRLQCVQCVWLPSCSWPMSHLAFQQCYDILWPIFTCCWSPVSVLFLCSLLLLHIPMNLISSSHETLMYGILILLLLFTISFHSCFSLNSASMTHWRTSAMLCHVWLHNSCCRSLQSVNRPGLTPLLLLLPFACSPSTRSLPISPLFPPSDMDNT